MRWFQSKIENVIPSFLNSRWTELNTFSTACISCLVSRSVLSFTLLHWFVSGVCVFLSRSGSTVCQEVSIETVLQHGCTCCSVALGEFDGQKRVEVLSLILCYHFFFQFIPVVCVSVCLGEAKATNRCTAEWQAVDIVLRSDIHFSKILDKGFPSGVHL